MYLKQLTLRGFKSFASATTMVFEPGITCVVGPNGSGKSNVVDALSWVMGEQGAKSLRGGKMEDVIFAGTAKRAPLGRAEVELTIDNSDGALPIDYSEVTITRTMFRSGGSEYQINGQAARLLDVQELLSDSGIGHEMHVIVGQGQLDAILAATPESRRGFIEEAAGVLKHRKRKERALRKLDGTKHNLERLTDLIAELQRQLKPLGRQAQAARKAAVIQAELRDAKARLLADDLHLVSEALAADLADEQAYEAATRRAREQAQQATAAETATQERHRELAARYEQSQELWYALAGLKERVATTLSISAERMRLADAQPQLEIAGKDPEMLEREAEEVAAREATLAKRVEQANADLTEATLRRNEAESAHRDEEQSYATALRAVADRRESLARLRGQVNSVASRIEAADEEIARLQRRHDEALERAKEAVSKYHATETKLAGLGSTESNLDADYEHAAALVEQRTLELDQLKAREAAAQRDKAAARARVDALTLATTRKDGSQSLLTNQLADGRLSDQLSVDLGWEMAVAVALGAAADAVTVSDAAAAATALDHLHTHNLGRAWVVVESAVRAPVVTDSIAHHVQASSELEPSITRLLGQIVACQDRDHAQRLIRTNPETVAVTKQGELFCSWLVTGGSVSAPSLLELSAQLTHATEQMEAHSHDLERLTFAIAGAQEAVDAARAVEQDALQALHSSDAELAAVADALSQAKQTEVAARREATRLAEAVEAATQARSANETSLASLKARLTAATDDDVIEPDPSRRDELADAARIARQQDMDARLALRTAQEQAKALAGRADGLRRAAAKERASRERAAAKLNQIRAEAEVSAVVNRVASTLAAQIDRAIVSAGEQRLAADQARHEAENAMIDARDAAKAATAALDELIRGAHKDELSRIEHRMRMEQLTDKARSELGLEPETLIAEYGPDQLVPVISGTNTPDETKDDEQPQPVPYVREEQSKRLKAAERNLQILGRINPLALEEYDAMKARHAFLAEQLDDLKRTRADLLEIIEQVDARVKEVFEAAYRDVSAAFVDIFARLFPGGEGKLVLTEPGQWLTTGVDVEAKPAGKQVKRLSLLSGGERSLVAVAFLVSLFIARPSPFYILDEVEAALDDTNLGRLLAIYEQLRESSQLLIITHQKRTMAIADSLYGVSMRGDGISTVVSQRLEPR